MSYFRGSFSLGVATFRLTFLWLKLSFFLTERQSQSYRKYWDETQEKERRKVRAVSTKRWDNAQLRTVSLFSWYVEQNVWDTHYDQARDWRREMGEARKRERLPSFSSRAAALVFCVSRLADVHSPHKIWRKWETAHCRVLVKLWEMLRSWVDQQTS